MLKLFSVGTFLFGCVIAFDYQPKIKLFEIILDRVEILYENPEIFETHLKIRKMNKTRVLIGNIDIRKPIGNDFNAEYKILKKQGGEYRYLPYAVPASPLCKFFKKDTYIYPELARNSDLPEDIVNNCPLAGNYSFYGYNVNAENMVKVGAPSGEYAGEVIVNHDGKNVLIMRVFVYVNNI